MTIFTIGHSNHPIQIFLGFLHYFTIQLLVDVRSNPYSKYHPQFTYDTLKKYLTAEDYLYIYLGDKIGGIYPDNNLQFIDGGVDYSKVESLQKFRVGIDQLIHLSNEYENLAIMCSEKDPYFCHRFVLISHVLSKKGIITHHILPGASNTISNVELEDRMRSDYGSNCSLDEVYSHHNRVMFHEKV